MSRQAHIVEALVTLQRKGVILSWVKDEAPGNPNRIHWHIMLDPVTSRRWTTPEAEAFIEGWRRAVLVSLD